MGKLPNPEAQIRVKGNTLLLNRRAQDMVDSGECEIQKTEDGIRIRPIRVSRIGRHRITCERFIAVGKSMERYGVKDGDKLTFSTKLPGGVLEFHLQRPPQ